MNGNICRLSNRTNIFIQLFQRIRIEKPQVLKKVIPFNGDICSDNLGLTDKEHEQLINEVNIVFHCAASLQMHAKLKDAVEMNMVRNNRLASIKKFKSNQFKSIINLVNLNN